MEKTIQDNENNPRMQCNMCGQWKRLFGRGEQIFYGGCVLEKQGGDPHTENVCEDCCKKHHYPNLK